MAGQIKKKNIDFKILSHEGLSHLKASRERDTKDYEFLWIGKGAKPSVSVKYSKCMEKVAVSRFLINNLRNVYFKDGWSWLLSTSPFRSGMGNLRPTAAAMFTM